MSEENNNLATENTNEYRAQRLANLKALEELGYNPFGAAFDRTGDVAAIGSAGPSACGFSGVAASIG